MLRHPDYTRARIAATARRLRDQVYPDVRPADSLRSARASTGSAGTRRARSPIGQPRWASSSARSGARSGSDVRATVPQAWDGRRVDLLLGDAQRGDAVARRAQRAGPQLGSPASGRTPRCASTLVPAERARVPGRGRLQRQVRRRSTGTTPRSSRSSSTAATSRCFDKQAWTLCSTSTCCGSSRPSTREASTVARGAAARPS